MNIPGFLLALALAALVVSIVATAPRHSATAQVAAAVSAPAHRVPAGRKYIWDQSFSESKRSLPPDKPRQQG